MKLTKISKSDDNIVFNTQDVSVAYLNALRRSVMDYVPTLAIEDVEVRKNSSVMYDEVLAHRLGLLPITTEIGSYTFRVEGESSMGSECVLTLTASDVGTVYAEQIKSKDAKAVPAQGKMPITKLLKGQELEVEAKAILGRGIEHAKWSPGVVFYEYTAEVSVDNKAPELANHINRFPKEVVKDGKVDKAAIAKLGMFDAVDGIYPEAVQVNYNPSSLNITIESFGQMSPDEMVKQGCAYISEALKELSQAVKNL